MRRLYTTPEARLLALGRAFRARWFVRFLAASVIAMLAASAGGEVIGGAMYVLVVAGTFVVVAFVAQAALLGFRLRRALQSFSWVGRWEWLRARDLAGGKLPRTRKDLDALLAVGRDPHPFWVELLTHAGRRADALRMAQSLPAGTAWERFEREAIVSYVGWIDTGVLEDARARDALAELDDEECVRAEAMLAIDEARARLVAGDDWLEPLVAVRSRIGARAKGILLHDWWPTRARETAIVAVLVTVAFLVLD